MKSIKATAKTVPEINPAKAHQPSSILKPFKQVKKTTKKMLMNPKIGKAYLALVIGVALLVMNQINNKLKPKAITVPTIGEVIMATETLIKPDPEIPLHPIAQTPAVAKPKITDLVIDTGIP